MSRRQARRCVRHSREIWPIAGAGSSRIAPQLASERRRGDS
jgi:hypothetical protein